MSDHPHPNESRFDGCPYCDADIRPERVASHLTTCNAVPSTDEVADI